MAIVVKIVKGAGEGQSYTVPDGKTLTLGRGSDASFMLPDPLLSREHCALRCGEDGCVLIDLKSLNGTFLNGKRMSEPRNLEVGDKLRIGSILFEVLVSEFTFAPGVGSSTFGRQSQPGTPAPIGERAPEPDMAIPPTSIVPAPFGSTSSSSSPAFVPSVPVWPESSEPVVDVPMTIVVPPPFPPPFPVRAALPPMPPVPSGTDPTRTCESCGALLAQDEERTMCPSCFDRFDVKENLLDGFRILERVFRTPTGTVYKAEQPLLGRTVLVKTITTTGWEQDEKTIRRFLREAKAAARLSHPSIVEFYDVSEQADNLFIVMEHVDGPTLEQLVARGGPVPPRRAVRHMAQIAEALAFVHGHKVVHRDVRPGTILVGQTEDRAKLADFTLARNVEIAAFGEITATGDMLSGIPYFESPEQVRESKRADLRSDIYSYGATFFYELSGQRPIAGNNYIEFLSRLAVESAPPIESVVSGLPTPLAELVNRCLQRDPGARFQSMDEVQETVVHVARVLGVTD